MLKPHTLTIAEDGEGGYDCTIDCPGLTDKCRAWKECRVPDCTGDKLYDNDLVGHFQKHAFIAGTWHVPDDWCFLAAMQQGVPEAVDNLRGELSTGGLPPGRYLVTATFDPDFGSVDEFELVEVLISGGAA